MAKGDAFGYSPDIGKYVVRDGRTYSEYGYIYEAHELFRSMPRPVDSHENYADWSDERRAAQHATNDRQREEYEREQKKTLDERHDLVRSAKKKLTEEEFDAVRSWACDDEDGWDPASNEEG